MQGDGNFVVYSAENVALFATNTLKEEAAYLDVQDDGNIVMYKPYTKRVVWATNTSSKC
jgi:hypothetical protein